MTRALSSTERDDGDLLDQIRALLPLEESEVETFDELVFRYAEQEVSAARFSALLGLLTEREVPYLEVRDSAAAQFRGVHPAVHAQGLAAGFTRVDAVTGCTILRWVLSSPEHTASLAEELGGATPETRRAFARALRSISQESLLPTRDALLRLLGAAVP